MEVTVTWGDYRLQLPDEELGKNLWKREHRQEPVTISIPQGKARHLEDVKVPQSLGLEIAVAVRELHDEAILGDIPKGSRSVSLFLVNRREPKPDATRDEANVFQAGLKVECSEGFVSRPNLRNLETDDWDMQVADLQYRCLLYTSPSPRDQRGSRMPSSA